MPAPAVWKVRSVEGIGWLRETFEGAPIMTADPSEAQQFGTRADAVAAVAGMPRDRVAMRVVAAAAHPVHEHGK